jgi:DNA mismatch endonuclease (patch repair protein)
MKGIRFRVNVAKLPGTPDIVMLRYRTVVDVRGCFWHQHGCHLCRTPKTNKKYWLPKLARNQERDAANFDRLSGLGWLVFVIWECEIQNPASLKRKLNSLQRSWLRETHKSSSEAYIGAHDCPLTTPTPPPIPHGDADHGGVELVDDVGHAGAGAHDLKRSDASIRPRQARGTLRSSTRRVREYCQIVVAKRSGESRATRGDYGMAAS